MKRRAYVWVIEVWCYAKRKWLPTVGCALNVRDARRELKDWRYNNPADKYIARRFYRGKSYEKTAP